MQTLKYHLLYLEAHKWSVGLPGVRYLTGLTGILALCLV